VAQVPSLSQVAAIVLAQIFFADPSCSMEKGAGASGAVEAEANQPQTQDHFSAPAAPRLRHLSVRRGLRGRTQGAPTTAMVTNNQQTNKQVQNGPLYRALKTDDFAKLVAHEEAPAKLKEVLRAVALLVPIWDFRRGNINSWRECQIILGRDGKALSRHLRSFKAEKLETWTSCGICWKRAALMVQAPWFNVEELAQTDKVTAALADWVLRVLEKKCECPDRPLMDELRKADFQELRSFSDVPAGGQEVCEVLALLFPKGSLERITFKKPAGREECKDILCSRAGDWLFCLPKADKFDFKSVTPAKWQRVESIAKEFDLVQLAESHDHIFASLADYVLLVLVTRTQLLCDMDEAAQRHISEGDLCVITVTLLSGIQETFEVEEATAVDGLKLLIQARLGHRPVSQQLCLGDTPLIQHETSLKELGITSSSSISLAVRSSKTSSELEASDLKEGTVVRLISDEALFKRAFKDSGYRWDKGMRKILGTEQIVVQSPGVRSSDRPSLRGRPVGRSTIYVGSNPTATVFGLEEATAGSGQPVWYYPLSVVEEAWPAA